MNLAPISPSSGTDTPLATTPSHSSSSSTKPNTLLGICYPTYLLSRLLALRLYERYVMTYGGILSRIHQNSPIPSREQAEMLNRHYTSLGIKTIQVDTTTPTLVSLKSSTSARLPVTPAYPYSKAAQMISYVNEYNAPTFQEFLSTLSEGTSLLKKCHTKGYTILALAKSLMSPSSTLSSYTTLTELAQKAFEPSPEQEDEKCESSNQNDSLTRPFPLLAPLSYSKRDQEVVSVASSSLPAPPLIYSHYFPSLAHVFTAAWVMRPEQFKIALPVVTEEQLNQMTFFRIRNSPKLLKIRKDLLHTRYLLSTLNGTTPLRKHAVGTLGEPVDIKSLLLASKTAAGTGSSTTTVKASATGTIAGTVVGSGPITKVPRSMPKHVVEDCVAAASHDALSLARAGAEASVFLHASVMLYQIRQLRSIPLPMVDENKLWKLAMEDIPHYESNGDDLQKNSSNLIHTPRSRLEFAKSSGRSPTGRLSRSRKSEKADKRANRANKTNHVSETDNTKSSSGTYSSESEAASSSPSIGLSSTSSTGSDKVLWKWSEFGQASGCFAASHKVINPDNTMSNVSKACEYQIAISCERSEVWQSLHAAMLLLQQDAEKEAREFSVLVATRANQQDSDRMSDSSDFTDSAELTDIATNSTNSTSSVPSTESTTSPQDSLSSSALASLIQQSTKNLSKKSLVEMSIALNQLYTEGKPFSNCSAYLSSLNSFYGLQYLVQQRKKKDIENDEAAAFAASTTSTDSIEGSIFPSTTAVLCGDDNPSTTALFGNRHVQMSTVAAVAVEDANLASAPRYPMSVPVIVFDPSTMPYVWIPKNFSALLYRDVPAASRLLLANHKEYIPANPDPLLALDNPTALHTVITSSNPVAMTSTTSTTGTSGTTNTTPTSTTPVWSPAKMSAAAQGTGVGATRPNGINNHSTHAEMLERLPQGNTTFNLLWTWRQASLDHSRLNIFQRINHFKNAFNLTRKDFLKRNISRYAKIVPAHLSPQFDFMPRTYILPLERGEFVDHFAEREKGYVAHDISSGKRFSFYNYDTPIDFSAAKAPIKTDGQVTNTSMSDSATSTAAPSASTPMNGTKQGNVSQALSLLRTKRSGFAGANPKLDRTASGTSTTNGTMMSDTMESEAPIVESPGFTVPPGHPSNLWIIKPTNSSRGRGIYLTNDMNTLPFNTRAVAQEYIPNPYLLFDRKFDFRLYVLVTSFEPLEAFIYSEGFARFAMKPYTTHISKLDDLFVHLTNSSINQNFSGDADADDDDDSAAPLADSCVDDSSLSTAATSTASTRGDDDEGENGDDETDSDAPSLKKKSKKSSSSGEGSVANTTGTIAINGDIITQNTSESSASASASLLEEEEVVDLSSHEAYAEFTKNRTQRSFTDGQEYNSEQGHSKILYSDCLKLLEKDGVNVPKMLRAIDLVIIKTLLCVKSRIGPQPNAFEVFGFDIMIDDACRPWLIEVNASPSLNLQTPIDMAVKPRMVADTIKLVDPIPYDREYLASIMAAYHATQQWPTPPTLSYDASEETKLEYHFSKLLGDRVPRIYGQVPARMGGYRRIAPGGPGSAFYGLNSFRSIIGRIRPANKGKKEDIVLNRLRGIKGEHRSSNPYRDVQPAII